MFGFISRARHRGEDVDDIRSHVLDTRMDFDRPEPFSPRSTPVQQPPPLPDPDQPFGPRFESRYGESSAAFGEPVEKTDKTGRDYDIMDRLNLIESQLAAVRSMTETINERLKNMDAKLGARRY